MNILLVILHADPARGGAERYTLDLAQALTQRGHAVCLGARTFARIPAGVQRVDLNGGGVTRLGQYRRFLDELTFHRTDHRYDIVHAMLPVRRCDVYHPHAGVAAAAKSGRWSYNLRRRAMAATERNLLTGASPPVVLCLSQVIQRTVKKHYTLAEDRLAMLFNAVDLAHFDPAAHAEAGRDLRIKLGIDGHTSVVAMIAQDFHRKGLDQTLRAMAAMQAGGQSLPSLLVAGRDDARPFIRLARELAIHDHVSFLGPLADPRPLYAAVDMLVLPTRHDPCSLVVLEALAMGVPVITTRCNGASEIMTDQVHGFVLAQADDVPALANAMRQLGDPATHQRMNHACLELRRELAYERHLEHLESIYQRIAER